MIVLKEPLVQFNQQVQRDSEEAGYPWARFRRLINEAKSPREERDLWKAYFLSGQAVTVNRKHCYIVEKTPILKQLLKQGFIKQVRRNRSYNKQRLHNLAGNGPVLSATICNHTMLVLNK